MDTENTNSERFLAIIESPASRRSDDRLAKLAGMCGIPTEIARIPSDSSLSGLAEAWSSRPHAIAIHAGILKRARVRANSGGRWRDLLDQSDYALIYGCVGPETAEIVEELVPPGLQGSLRVNSTAARFSFPSGTEQVCEELSGGSFRTCASGSIPVFEAAGNDSLVIMRVEDHPFFAAKRSANGGRFFLSSDEVEDIDREATPDDPSSDALACLLPFLIFFRQAFGNQCWKSAKRHAVLTIDDPLLRSRYGCLSYRQLVRAIREHGFAATIAFIPWNYRRTDQRTALLFSRNSDVLSLCIHGCDHVKREFGVSNLEETRSKARTALERMRAHERITGLGYERLMVFPQGVFSRAALEALSKEGYLAAVNTSVFPCDYEGELKLRDLLEPAMTRYGFPVFGRRYPEKSSFKFAVDSFLGKPCIITAHHENFRGGYESICNTVDGITALDPNLSWVSLQRAVSSTVHLRWENPGRCAVRCYTNRVLLQNPHGRDVTIVLEKRLASEPQLPRLSVNGMPIECELSGSLLRAEFRLEAQLGADIRFASPESADVPREALGMWNEGRVAIRRYLSELRDNWLSKSETLAALSSNALRLFSR